MTKALLLLTGGRGVPDMLVIKYLRPDVVFNLTTRQGLRVAENLQKVVDEEFGIKIEILPVVSPFKEEEIKLACATAFDKVPDANWIVAHTSAPKMLSIFAIDVAREHNIPCWFLNTNDTEVISLVRNVDIDYNRLFDATVDEYMKVYERTYNIPKPKEYRDKAEKWFDIAKALACMPEYTYLLLKALRISQHGQAIEKSITIKISERCSPLLEELQKYQILTIDAKTDSMLTCTITGGDSREFLNGDWLEVYVWEEVKRAEFVNDYRWGYKITTGLAESELDIAFTYKGLLSVVECKTDNDPFTDKRKVYLDTLDSIANSLGQSYTSKFFITSHPYPDTLPSYSSFKEQATKKRIFIITGEELRNIGEILKQQVMTPFFERI